MVGERKKMRKPLGALSNYVHHVLPVRRDVASSIALKPFNFFNFCTGSYSSHSKSLLPPSIPVNLEHNALDGRLEEVCDG